MELQTTVEIERHRARPVWDDTTEWLAVHRRLREYSRQRATLDARRPSIWCVPSR